MRSILLALALLVALVAPSHAAETQVTIVASTTTGVWYPLATALSSDLRQGHEGHQLHRAANPRLTR